MNSHIAKALDQTRSGNVYEYLASNDNIIEANSGIHDNKFLSIDAYDPPCPVLKGNYTKVKLTDRSIDVVDIDKSSLVARVHFTLKADKSLMDVLNQEYTNTGSDVYKQKLVSLKNQMFKIFYGLKSSIHLFDAYRIYSNGRKTLCEQTEALYESAMDRMLKAQEELDEKPQIYTKWDRAKSLDEAICGTYISLEDFRVGRNDMNSERITPGTVVCTFMCIVPLDDFLPLNGMTMFPSCVFGDLTMEVKLAIQNNLVLCQCDPEVSAREYLAAAGTKISTYDSIGQVTAIADLMGQTPGQSYKRAFTQIGDSFDLRILKVKVNLMPVDKETLVTPEVVEWLNVSFAPQCTAGTLIELRSNLNGFNIKDSVKDQIREKYSKGAYIVPGQFIDFQAFSQSPKYSTTRCNNTYTLTNVTAIGFLFPRTQNEITCSRNPNLSAIQAQIEGKIYPDKPFSTHSAEHTNYNLTNAGFNGLFSASREYGYSLRFNDMAVMDKYNGADTMTGCAPSEDNTSYCFLVSTERLSGYGTFCDGITATSAQVSLSMTPFGASGSNPNPYVEGHFSPIMLVVQDCFWKCTDKGCEFIRDDPGEVAIMQPAVDENEY